MALLKYNVKDSKNLALSSKYSLNSVRLSIIISWQFSFFHSCDKSSYYFSVFLLIMEKCSFCETMLFRL